MAAAELDVLAFCCCVGSGGGGGFGAEGPGCGGAGGRTERAVVRGGGGGGGGQVDSRATSWVLVEDNSSWEEATVPVRAATCIRMKATRDSSKTGGAIVDDSDSSTHNSASGGGGEVLPLCRLVGDVERYLPLRKNTGARVL